MKTLEITITALNEEAIANHLIIIMGKLMRGEKKGEMDVKDWVKGKFKLWEDVNET